MMSENSAAKFTSAYLIPIELFTKLRGLDWEKVVNKFDLNPAIAADPDSMSSFEEVVAVYEFIAQLANDDAAGVTIGSDTPLGIAGVFDYVALSAPTLRVAMQNWVRFHDLPTNAFSLEFTENSRFGYLKWEISESYGPNTQFIGVVFAFIVSRIRYIANDPSVNPVAEFKHSKPGNIEEYERHIGPNLQFNRPHARLAIPANLLSESSPQCEPNLYDIIEQTALKKLREQENKSDQIFLITQRISKSLINGNVSIETIAREMGMSGRSLQRILKSSGTNFRELTEKVRKSLSKHYLTQTDISLNEIAFMLGYSDQSAFSRAARGWFGVSPRTYRIKHGARSQ